jgi:isoleucyl-tRNA synthetase
MPKSQELQKISNVHLLEWQATLASWNNQSLADQYNFLLVSFRPHVLKALEEKRQAGTIGSSLEAQVTIETASDQDFHRLTAFDENVLKAAFIVSQVTLKKVSQVAQGVSVDFLKTVINVEKASGGKCLRCWNYNVAPGQDGAHGELCQRCTSIVHELKRNV